MTAGKNNSAHELKQVMPDYLPSLYRERGAGEFLRQFLAAFEKVLPDLKDRQHPFVDEEDETA